MSVGVLQTRVAGTKVVTLITTSPVPTAAICVLVHVWVVSHSSVLTNDFGGTSGRSALLT